MQVLGALLGVVLAADAPEWSLGGLVFGDIYHVPQHHADEGEDATGVVMRRGYLTLDVDWGKGLSSRFRLEANQSGEFEDYDFEVDFKDVYLRYFLGRQRVTLGLSPTPTFDLIESTWDARYLMRTPLDLQGVASRDTGIALTGPLNASGSIGYRAMLGAGAEFGAETGDGRKFMLGLNWEPKENWVVDLYADHEKLPGPTDRRTVQFYTGFQDDGRRWGFQYSDQDREQDPPLELISTFYVHPIHDRLRFLGRIDRLLEPSPRGDGISYLPFDGSAKATMFLAGLEWRTGRNLHLTPNVVWIDYQRNAEGIRPPSDLQLRLTVFLDLE